MNRFETLLNHDLADTPPVEPWKADRSGATEAPEGLKPMANRPRQFEPMDPDWRGWPEMDSPLAG